MNLRFPRAPRARATALAAALAATTLAGCGEVTNTIAPPAGSANEINVVLAGPPNAFYAGIYEADALGYFRQTDINVNLVVPGAGQDPVTMVHSGQALIGIASEVDVLLHRNVDEPVVGVATILHGPLSGIPIRVPRPGPSGGAAVTTTRTKTKTRSRARTTTTAARPTTTTFAEPDTPLWPAALQQLLSKPGFPSYDGLVVVVRKGTIVGNAGLVRRFVQALARGYSAAGAHPGQAIANLIAAVPSLAPSRPLQLATLKAALPSFFPPTGKVWGWLRQSQWNAFGEWLNSNHLLSNPNAITDATTNELLPGQGV